MSSSVKTPSAGARTSKAAIYARDRSKDTDKLAIAKQIEACRELAAQQGWTVVEEYIDDDPSAQSGKHRPAYRRMLCDFNAMHFDAMVVFDGQSSVRGWPAMTMPCVRAPQAGQSAVPNQRSAGSGRAPRTEEVDLVLGGSGQRGTESIDLVIDR